jgi:hypothetical protein
MFLQDVPLSAYLLCYGPLAVTIIGFIVYAALTDSDARRTYLRRDPRLPDGVVPPVERHWEARTPSNARVSISPPPYTANQNLSGSADASAASYDAE